MNVAITEECAELDGHYDIAKKAAARALEDRDAARLALQPWRVGHTVQAKVLLPGQSYRNKAYAVCKIVSVRVGYPAGWAIRHLREDFDDESPTEYVFTYGVRRIKRDGDLAQKVETVDQVFAQSEADLP